MSDDSKIIDLFFSRDERAIAEVSFKYGAVCSKISKNILKNEADAEECVSDTYLALWNTIPPERPKPLKAYILRILRNISIAKYHSNTALKRNSFYDVALDELKNTLSSVGTVYDGLELSELSGLIDAFLDTVDKESRLMFMCRYWAGYSISDIAEKFQLSNNNVSVRLSRIREKLKKYLMKEGFEV